MGLARITDESGFAVIYSKDSRHSGSGYEFWCTRLDAKGPKVFTKMIYGEVQEKVFDSKGEPGTFSSGRLFYNKASTQLGSAVPLENGIFGALFTTANGRNAFDVAYRRLSATGTPSPSIGLQPIPRAHSRCTRKSPSTETMYC